MQGWSAVGGTCLAGAPPGYASQESDAQRGNVSARDVCGVRAEGACLWRRSRVTGCQAFGSSAKRTTHVKVKELLAFSVHDENDDDMSLCLARGRARAACVAPRALHTAHYATLKTTPAPVQSVVKRAGSIQLGFGANSQASIEYRSLLRAILREASYLPDPNARAFFKARALQHSRKRAFRVWERRNDPNYAEREADLLALDRKKLRMLQKANTGDRTALLQVLYQTYGRTGLRRRELLRPLLPTIGREALAETAENAMDNDDVHDSMNSQEDVQEKLDARQSSNRDRAGTTVATSRGSILPQLTPELSTLAKSQKQNQPPTLTRKNPRRLRPDIPATNARMLPMPQKRVKNMHRKWYAELLDRILPPLPTKDWDQLHDWARGRNLPQIHVPRRIKPPARPFAHFGKYTALEAIVIQGRIDKGVHGNDEAHQITERFMQRLWGVVFSTCPYMIHDTSTDKWRVIWGHQKLAQSRLNAINKPTMGYNMPDLIGG
ncbi:hypothetical protein CERZMDRAFT_84141 [Cercospora zeae-maydis SCOH1-5]|uniref:LYR motif-containing protein Cup1-like N-terminal domain-containing protein n=1 Tax=Cercospora zeae-maydis SCOH1-5 TaxID=717836 RepID=A0A6A6FIP8_9PEZI|nr:hypothetical protein CERZMDRAFT_84141 [Cercospora zeae-maydis SCOH1-5]